MIPVGIKWYRVRREITGHLGHDCRCDACHFRRQADWENVKCGKAMSLRPMGEARDARYDNISFVSRKAEALSKAFGHKRG